jgi:DNA polymerase III subunit gamma/tau
MENFIVSARKYRPDSFDTVIAQSSITQTLKNAIKNDKLAHAYLFCGPRGVGKTTCARIFAKTINCSNLSSEAEACNECESCKAFNSNRSYNIHELDAASNNSVDDIRLLIDQVRIPPQVGKYSVYIIDEVHMLSQQAFNAFLKTLEEPPLHAIFILATTEKHKIIPTILSRCQIFDFNRISISDIADHLEYVAKNEGVDIEKEALNIIAQKADGAMRDALSIFDQIVSYSGKNITYEEVLVNLNVLDHDYYFRLIDHFLKYEVPEILMIFDDILHHGFDGHHFIIGLSNHLRNLLVCKDKVTLQLLEVGGDIRDRYKIQANNCEAEFLINALEISNECDGQYKIIQNKRLLIELALIRIAQLTQKKKIIDTSHQEDILQPVFSKESSDNHSVKVKKSSPAKEAIPEKKLRRLSSEISGPSIKDALAGKFNEDKLSEKDRHEIYVNSDECEDFSQEEFNREWELLLELYKDRPNLQSTLSKKPTLGDGYKLILEIENTMQEDLINSVKPELVSMLRRKLKNSKINLVTHVSLTEKNKIIYTDSDKYREMVKMNPALELLKERFKLDFE